MAFLNSHLGPIVFSQHLCERGFVAEHSEITNVPFQRGPLLVTNSETLAENGSSFRNSTGPGADRLLASTCGPLITARVALGT